MAIRDTRWPAGTPCWVEVSADDVPQAVAFYHALFGWDIRSDAPGPGGYSIAHAGGRIVAAVSPKMGPTGPRPRRPRGRPTWPPTTSRPARPRSPRPAVSCWPGRSTSPPRAGWRWRADPAGAAFGLWQGGRTTGIGLANEPGALAWSEQFSRDRAGSLAFYTAAFGYGFQDMSGDGFSYGALTVGGHIVGGLGEYPADAPAGFPRPGPRTSPSPVPTRRWPG